MGEQAGTSGSILPAVWSFMLAARARGLGTVWTTAQAPLERELAQFLGSGAQLFPPGAPMDLECRAIEPAGAAVFTKYGRPAR